MARDDDNSIHRALGRIEAQQASMAQDITDIKKDVGNYKADKNKLIGICLGVAAVVGGGFSALMNKLGINI